MNSNLDLVKERMRVDHSHVEDQLRTIGKHTDQLQRTHEQMLELKAAMSADIQRECAELREEVLAVKKHFDEQRDHVTQFDSTVQYLKKQAKKQKKDTEESHLELKKELEGYRLEMLRAERAYDAFNGQID